MGKKPNKTEQAALKEQERTTAAKIIMLAALTKSLGVVTEACKATEIGRTQFYLWLNEDKEFKKAVEDMENIAIDFAETALHKQITDGVPASTMFYLKTRGKKRGYVERTEFTGKDGEPLIESNEDRINRIAVLKAKLDG